MLEANLDQIQAAFQMLEAKQEVNADQMLEAIQEVSQMLEVIQEVS
jgi:hypothetical protein